MKALIWDEDRLGATFRVEEIPADLKEQASGYRDKMIESLADHDEHIMELYLEGKHPDPEKIRAAIRAATLKIAITPVLLGSAFRNKGVQPMLDAVVDYLPSPLDLPPVVGNAGDICAVGLRDTTTGDTLCDPAHPIVLESIEFPEPVIQIAIEPKTKVDQEKLSEALQKLAKEDPSFRVSVNKETSQTLISGMGELHLEIIVDRMLREFKVDANIGKPQVAYRETIKRASEAEGKLVRQSGGHGQYAVVELRIEPLAKGLGFEFEDGTKGGSISRNFIPAIEAGVKEAMENGVLAGYPMVDIKAIVIDGKEHDVDSSELAFKIAGSMAFKEACERAEPVLLEPIMEVEVVTPQEFMGEVIGDLSGRRGKILDMENRAGAQVIEARVPLATMFGYATRVRSMTQGRATYTMQFGAYEPVPRNIFEELTASNGKAA